MKEEKKYLTFSPEADKRLFAQETKFYPSSRLSKGTTHPGIREYHKANQPSALSTRFFTLLTTSLRNIRRDGAYTVPQPV